MPLRCPRVLLRSLFAAAALVQTVRPAPLCAAPALPAGQQANASLRSEVDEALHRGTRWLEQQQNAEGFWSDPRHPALSALALLALERAKRDERQSARGEIVEKGFRFLRAQAKADGGLYAEGLSNYNTALSVLALLGHGDPRDAALVRQARAFLVQQQASQLTRPELNGGIGYGPNGVNPKRQHPDLDNTLVSLEALRACELADAAREPQPGAARLDWKAAIAFVSRCQNLPETNPQEWVARQPAERGGFVYYPGFSNAGESVDDAGRKALRSSGSMSYAGLLSFIYAELPKQDPRVEAALTWLRQNYTLTENPGLGRQGLFYYYHLMAKALSAAGVTELQTNAGSRNWARELAVELINRQEAGGHWVNDTGRWMEKDPVLVTSYSLLTLNLLRERL